MPKELPLFYKQLETIKNIMHSTTHKKLTMCKWLSPDREGEPSKIFDCGYSACVCGHVAVAGDLKNFKMAEEHRIDLCEYHGLYYMLTFEDYASLAALINLDMQVACTRLLGEQFLSDSINCLNERFQSAVQSHLFNVKELSVIDHLQEKDSTPQHAYEYIQLILNKLSKQLPTK